MKITEHIYQVSGNSFGTNSSTYIADAGDQLILFDAGYSEYQLQVIYETLKRWKLDKKRITHTFLTHVHMDHAANAKRIQQAGSKILIGEKDADTLEKGGPQVLESLFQKKFVPCTPDIQLREGDEFSFGDIKITCVSIPGHTPGSMGFLVEDHGITCFVTGDFVALGAVEPDESDQDVLLGAMIKPGFQEEQYGESLKRAISLKADILLTGHLLPYIGNSSKIFEKAYKKFMQEEKKILDISHMRNI